MGRIYRPAVECARTLAGGGSCAPVSRQVERQAEAHPHGVPARGNAARGPPRSETREWAMLCVVGTMQLVAEAVL